MFAIKVNTNFFQQFNFFANFSPPLIFSCFVEIHSNCYGEDSILTHSGNNLDHESGEESELTEDEEPATATNADGTPKLVLSVPRSEKKKNAAPPAFKVCSNVLPRPAIVKSKSKDTLKTRGRKKKSMDTEMKVEVSPQDFLDSQNQSYNSDNESFNEAEWQPIPSGDEEDPLNTKEGMMTDILGKQRKKRPSEETIIPDGVKRKRKQTQKKEESDLYEAKKPRLRPKIELKSVTDEDGTVQNTILVHVDDGASLECEECTFRARSEDLLLIHKRRAHLGKQNLNNLLFISVK